MSGLDFVNLPFSSRPDMTPYLFHFTKKSDEHDALKILTKILKEGILKGSNKNIIGKENVVCFMDVPFNSLKYILRKDNKKKYEPYGIFITKKFAYKNGIRPVLYMSHKEIKALNIPQNEQWRIVRLESKEDKWISWLHEREWRIKGDFKLPPNAGVLVNEASEFKKLYNTIVTDEEKFEVKPRAILPLHIVCQGLNVREIRKKGDTQCVK
jgi:hypothetical protein